MQTTISWRLLKALIHSIPKDGARFALEGVRVEARSKSQLTLVATDGRTMVAATAPQKKGIPKGTEFTIPSLLIAALKPQKDEDVVMKVETGSDLKGSLWVTFEQAIHISAPVIDANYPNWRHPLKADGELHVGRTGAIDHAVLEIIHKVHKTLKPGKYLKYLPYCHDQMGIHFNLITDNVFVAYMPLRSDSPATFTLPEWAQ